MNPPTLSLLGCPGMAHPRIPPQPTTYTNTACASFRQFARIIPPLARRGHRVVAFDAFGCGQSPKPEGHWDAYATEELFLDLLEVYRRYKVGQGRARVYWIDAWTDGEGDSGAAFCCTTSRPLHTRAPAADPPPSQKNKTTGPTEPTRGAFLRLQPGAAPGRARRGGGGGAAARGAEGGEGGGGGSAVGDFGARAPGLGVPRAGRGQPRLCAPLAGAHADQAHHQPGAVLGWGWLGWWWVRRSLGVWGVPRPAISLKLPSSPPPS